MKTYLHSPVKILHKHKHKHNLFLKIKKRITQMLQNCYIALQ